MLSRIPSVRCHRLLNLHYAPRLPFTLLPHFFTHPLPCFFLRFFLCFFLRFFPRFFLSSSPRTSCFLPHEFPCALPYNFPMLSHFPRFSGFISVFRARTPSCAFSRSSRRSLRIPNSYAILLFLRISPFLPTNKLPSMNFAFSLDKPRARCYNSKARNGETVCACISGCGAVGSALPWGSRNRQATTFSAVAFFLCFRGKERGERAPDFHFPRRIVCGVYVHGRFNIGMP